MERKPEDYKNLIIKMAKQYYPSFYKRKEFLDLIQEGYETFVHVCTQEQKKPLTCSFHTALGIQLKQKWLNELEALKTIKRGKGITPSSLDLLLWEDGEEEPLINAALIYDPIDRIDRYLDLTSEMKMVISLLLETPLELIFLSKSFGLTESIIQYLKKFRGWKREKIEKLKVELTPLKEIARTL